MRSFNDTTVGSDSSLARMRAAMISLLREKALVRTVSSAPPSRGRSHVLRLARITSARACAPPVCRGQLSLVSTPRMLSNFHTALIGNGSVARGARV